MTLNSDAFAVNDSIRFYERDEIFDWIRNPNDNIFILAENGQQILGFLSKNTLKTHDFSRVMKLNVFWIPSSHKLPTLVGGIKKM